jgi:hypothetical protein
MDATLLKQLEAAARAAGYVPVGITDDETALVLEGIQQPWNPRDENPHSDCMGDALRLAVKLEIDVHHWRSRIEAAHCPRKLNGSLITERAMALSEHVNNGDDRFAATRRAIVRAAAAMEPPR